MFWKKIYSSGIFDPHMLGLQTYHDLTHKIFILACNFIEIGILFQNPEIYLQRQMPIDVYNNSHESPRYT